MAARLNRMHQDSVRAKIKASNIITVLQKHIDGEIKLSPTQVTSAKILLDKSISNAPTILAGDNDNPLVVKTIERVIVGEAQHTDS